LEQQTYNPWLLAVDPVAGAVTAQVNLATLQSNQQALAADVATSPDGATVYVSYQVMTTVGTGGSQLPYAFQVVDATSYTVTTTHLWGSDAGGSIAATAAGGRVFVDAFASASSAIGVAGSVLMLDTASGVRVASQLNLTSEYQLYPVPPSMPTADRSTFYLVTIDLTTLDPKTAMAELALAVIHVDAATGALSLARKVPLGLKTSAIDDALVEAFAWYGGGIAALSRDETTLYFIHVPNNVAVVTLADMSVQIWGSDPGALYGWPLAVGPQPGVVYIMLMEPTRVLVAISVGPP
jgi:hypothetical protein